MNKNELKRRRFFLFKLLVVANLLIAVVYFNQSGALGRFFLAVVAAVVLFAYMFAWFSLMDGAEIE